MAKETSIRLAALEPEDLDLLYTIENDREMWSIGNTNVPYSRYALRDYIINQQNDIFADKQVRLVIRSHFSQSAPSIQDSAPSIQDSAPSLRGRAGGEALGLIDLFNFSPEHSRAELGLAILNTERGKGYATQALQEMKKYAHDNLHLHQIYCIVPIDNAPSLAMLRTVGFTNEVVLRDWMQTPDGWQDAISLQCFL